MKQFWVSLDVSTGKNIAKIVISPLKFNKYLYCNSNKMQWPELVLINTCLVFSVLFLDFISDIILCL